MTTPPCSDRSGLFRSTNRNKTPLCSGCSDLFRSDTGTGAFHGVPMFRGVYPRNAGTDTPKPPLFRYPSEQTDTPLFRSARSDRNKNNQPRKVTER